MESNYSTLLKGRITDVVCAREGGANTTPLLSSVVHSAKQKTYNSFLLLQNMKSSGEFLKSETPSPNPARIPPQTPPAGGKRAEAGRIHIPSQLFRPAESALVPLEKGSRKVYNYSTSSNLFGIKNMERFCRSQNRALIFAKTLSACGGSREIP